MSLLLARSGGHCGGRPIILGQQRAKKSGEPAAGAITGASIIMGGEIPSLPPSQAAARSNLGGDGSNVDIELSEEEEGRAFTGSSSCSSSSAASSSSFYSTDDGDDGSSMSNNSDDDDEDDNRGVPKIVGIQAWPGIVGAGGEGGNHIAFTGGSSSRLLALFHSSGGGGGGDGVVAPTIPRVVSLDEDEEDDVSDENRVENEDPTSPSSLSEPLSQSRTIHRVILPIVVDLSTIVEEESEDEVGYDEGSLHQPLLLSGGAGGICQDPERGQEGDSEDKGYNPENKITWLLEAGPEASAAEDEISSDSLFSATKRSALSGQRTYGGDTRDESRQEVDPPEEPLWLRLPSILPVLRDGGPDGKTVDKSAACSDDPIRLQKTLSCIAALAFCEKV